MSVAIVLYSCCAIVIIQCVTIMWSVCYLQGLYIYACIFMVNVLLYRYSNYFTCSLRSYFTLVAICIASLLLWLCHDDSLMYYDCVVRPCYLKGIFYLCPYRFIVDILSIYRYCNQICNYLLPTRKLFHASSYGILIVSVPK